MEVGIFIAVPLLSDETSWDSKWYEGVSLYFIVQVVGSFIILASFYLSHELLDSNFNWISSAILCYSGLSLKLGLFPFHFWVRRSFSKFSYVGIFIAGSMCNANLVYAGSAIDYELWCYFFYVSSLIGMLYASFMMIFSVEVNVLLSYASVGFTSFLTLCSVIDCIHLIFVFSLLYCGPILMLTFVLSNSNCYYVNDLWADIPAKYKPVLF